MLQLSKFLFFNSGINFFDVATDLILFLQLEDEGHLFWAALTMLWMWSPFFSHLGLFICKISQAIYGEETCDFSFKTFYKEVLVHIPFVLPFQNAKRALRLYRLGYGSDGFEAKNASKVIIMISTGQVTLFQLISVGVSILSLSFGAARVFFVQRTPEEADPDPDISTVILRVWPYTFVMTVAYLLLWVAIGSFLGGFTILALLISYVVVWSTLRIQYFFSKRKQENRKRTEDTEAVVSRQLSSESNGQTMPFQDEQKKTTEFFFSQAALYAIWIPCVPGHKRHMLRTAAIASLVTKLVILGLAIGLNVAGYQDTIHPNHSFLLCINSTQVEEESKITTCSFIPEENSTVPHCFHSLMADEDYVDRMEKTTQIVENLKNLERSYKEYEKRVKDLGDVKFELPQEFELLLRIQTLIAEGREDLHNAGIDGIQQKKRLCSPNENELRLTIAITLAGIILLSILATIVLDNISDHKQLFQVSAHFLWFIPTPGLRAIHRYWNHIFWSTNSQHLIPRSLLFMALDKGNEDGITSTTEVAAAIRRKTESNMGKGVINKIMTALKSRKTQEKTKLAPGAERYDPEECKELLTVGDLNGNLNNNQTPSTYGDEDMEEEKDCINATASFTLIDKPNAKGVTPLIYSATLRRSYEATEVLLDHGANPNIPDSSGKTALHEACRLRDIRRVILLLKKRALFQKSNDHETPDMEKLFVERNEENIEELMRAIRTSQSKIDIYRKLFEERFLVFELLETRKLHILALVLGGSDPDPDLVEFLNVRGEEENTALHYATNHGLKEAISMLSAAGAAIKANKDDITPDIESCFVPENLHQLTGPIVHLLVKKTKKGLIKKEEAFEKLSLNLPDGRPVMSLLTEEKNWADLAGMCPDVMLRIAPRMGVDFIRWIVREASKEKLDQKKVGKMISGKNKDGTIILALLEPEKKQEVAEFNREAVLNVAHLMDRRFIEWLLKEATEGRWDKKTVGKVLNRKCKDGSVVLSILDKVKQREGAVLNKEATLNVAHLMEMDFIEWIIDETFESRWDKEDVGDMVVRENKVGKIILSLLDSNKQKQVALFNKDATISVAHLMGMEFIGWLLWVAQKFDWDREPVRKMIDKPDDTQGLTPLIHASKSKQNELMQILLEFGANPNVVDTDGQTALHEACSTRDLKQAILLLQNKAQFRESKKKEKPDIENLFLDESMENKEKLVKAICQSKEKKAIFRKIIFTANLEIVKMLLENGANPDVVDFEGHTPLYKACDAKDTKRAILLLQNKAHFKTPKDSKRPKIEKLFLDEDIQNIERLVIEIRKSEDKKEIYRELIEKHLILFDFLAKRNMEKLFLVLGKDSPEKDMAEFLDVFDKEKNTVLHYAASQGQSKIASILLAAGATLKGNGKGVTPKIEILFKQENLHDLTNHLVNALMTKANSDLTRAKDFFAIMDKTLPNGKPVMSLVEAKSWTDLRVLDSREMLKIAPRMDMEFLIWTVKEAREGHLNKKEVGEMMTRENREKKIILTQLSMEVQQEVVSFNKEATLEVAHLLNLEVIDWLVQEAMEGRWRCYKEKLVRMVTHSWRGETIILGLLGTERQIQVVSFNREATLEVAHLLNLDTIKWIMTRALEDEGWNRAGVHRALCKEKDEGKSNLACLNIGRLNWSQVAEWADMGICHRLENRELPAEIYKWSLAQEDAKKEAKEKVESLMNSKGVVVSLDSINKRDKRKTEEALQMWNRDMKIKCVLKTDCPSLINPKVGSSRSWTDRDQLRHGKLTAIEVQVNEEFGTIQKIRARYGSKRWANWRETGCPSLIDCPATSLQLGCGKIFGYSSDCNGEVLSLCSRNIEHALVDNVGDHSQASSISLRESPPGHSDLTLSHLSGDEIDSRWVLRFHWE